MIRIKEVAEAAGVSTATVSRVLADSDKVTPEMKEKVLATIKKMNYRPNRVARSLRSQKSNTIGLIVADIQNPFFSSISRAVEDTAQKHDMSLVLCNTDENPEKERKYLELLKDENVIGIIIAPTKNTNPGNINNYLSHGLSIVAIDRDMPGLKTDIITVNNQDSAFNLISHLLNDGKKTISGIFTKDSITGYARYTGYSDALKKFGMAEKNELTMFVPGKESEGYEAAKHLIAMKPDAIFTSSGLLAAGAFRAIRESGLSVPDEISFVTFDETVWTSFVEPPITLIKQPTYEIGRAATELLIERIANPDSTAKRIVLDCEFIIRKSCGHHPQM